MIYQLKIQLQHTSPPIWRRLLVDSNMKLSELHKTIQIAFEWEEMHLHCFEARKWNGVSLLDRQISIGINEEQLSDFFSYQYDERKEKLSDWLLKEKDKLVYVYDFGDDWRHEITLEKTLEPKAEMSYPYCVKAMRAPATEDSGGFWEEEEEEIEPEELLSFINNQLGKISRQVSVESVKSREKPSQWKPLFQLAKQYNELAPWQWLYDDQIFAIQHPKTGEYAYCSVMGASGEEFGFAAFIGQQGLEYLRKILTTPYLDEDSIYENLSIVLSFCDRKELSEKDYQLIKNEGLTFRGKKNWPMFRSMVPGLYPWYLSDNEMEWFSVILERALDVCVRVKEGLEIESNFSQNDVCFAQTALNNDNNVVWKDAFISTVIGQENRQPSELLVSEIDLKRVADQKRRFNVPLEIGSFYNPNPVQEHDDERPYFPEVFIVAERKNQMIVHHEMLPEGNRAAQVQASFMKLLENINAVPREIWMTSDMFLILRPMIEKLRISILQVDRLPIIENVKLSMRQFIE